MVRATASVQLGSAEFHRRHLRFAAILQPPRLSTTPPPLNKPIWLGL
jgi:hypothetical protein